MHEGTAIAEKAAGSLGDALPFWTAAPFVGILLSIALFPLVAPRFWHRHYPKVALAWAVLCVVPFVAWYGAEARHEVLEVALADYVPFIVLLTGLFAVTGGIAVKGRLPGTPSFNTGFLALGTLIASWIGTTGASMLFIRPMLRANETRRHKVHVVVFFIFLVSNIGGCLTPLGDPPLFLGFLHGVPFFWTMHLLPHMALVGGLVLVVFLAVDRWLYRREQRDGVGAVAPAETGRGLRVEGAHNLIFLLGIVAAVLLSGTLELGEISLAGVHRDVAGLGRDGAILAFTALSLWSTPRRVRHDNGFTWEPMREVAILFAGIFATIIPPLAILRAGESGAAGPLLATLSEPAHYFWTTGLLSSFLDNAPTYLAFFNMELGRLYPGLPEAQAVANLLREHPQFLEAVAAGAVFMGANTYIGNAPNFMVKAIAEERGVEMPSFFGYILRWTIPVLFPLFAVATWIFF